MTTMDFTAGRYRFIPGVFQYSAGVAALPGFEIVRVRFRTPLRLLEGMRQVEQVVGAAGRPLTAFCACELRSPEPFSEAGFKVFNEQYVTTLTRWGIYEGGPINPVARSNVCPQINAPSEPSVYAFSYTREASDAAPSFVIAGSAEAHEGPGAYSERTVRFQDVTPDGMRDKARHVLAEMERRTGLFRHDWGDASDVQDYTVHDLMPSLAEEIVPRGAARNGLTWHFARPPVVDLEYEMDCRGLSREIVE